MTDLVWRKSSRSAEGTDAQCVEVADLGGAIGMRDSRDPEGPHLTLDRGTLVALVSRIKSL
ncbi:DUF397 domain-containing protein [Spirillospora sp. NPDC127200]